MEQLKKWDEFFDKKNNGIIKENLNIPVNPNQFTIVYQEKDEVNGEVLLSDGYTLEIKTPQGIFYTKLKKYEDDDIEGEQ